MESLTVIEVLGAHGDVAARHRFTHSGTDRQLRVGRAIHCDVIVDDPRVAAEHLILQCNADGSVTVTDPGSINGLTLNGSHVRGAREVRLLDPIIGLGRTRIRVRRLGESLAPEQPVGGIGGRHRKLLLAAAGVAIDIDASVGARVVGFSLGGQSVLAGPAVHPESYGSTFWPSPQSAWATTAMITGLTP